MTTSISTKGQIIMPAEVRKKDRIRAGDKFTFERVKKGEYRLVRQKQKKTEGLVDWLLSCPVKGFYIPFDRSETTDSL